jgi:hypothetical protein
MPRLLLLPIELLPHFRQEASTRAPVSVQTSFPGVLDGRAAHSNSTRSGRGCLVALSSECAQRRRARWWRVPDACQSGLQISAIARIQTVFALQSSQSFASVLGRTCSVSHSMGPLCVAGDSVLDEPRASQVATPDKAPASDACDTGEAATRGEQEA